eukprot:6580932-Pyramimonas_sp.AAC.1
MCIRDRHGRGLLPDEVGGAGPALRHAFRQSGAIFHNAEGRDRSRAPFTQAVDRRSESGL